MFREAVSQLIRLFVYTDIVDVRAESSDADMRKTQQQLSSLVTSTCFALEFSGWQRPDSSWENTHWVAF